MFDENNNIIPEQNDYEQPPMPEVSPQANQGYYGQPYGTNYNGQNMGYTPYQPNYMPVPPPPPTEAELTRKGIRRAALGVGIPSLCLSLIGVIWSFVYLFITTKVFKMTQNDAIELTQNPAVQQILQIVLSCLMFLLPFGVAAKCMGLRIDKTVQFKKAKQGTFLPFVFFGIGFCAFANIAMSYVSSFFDSFGVDYEVDFGDNPKGIFGFLLSFIATAIVPALVEEFACRGIILGMLKRFGEGFAIVTSALVFGIMHGNFEQIPFAIMVGLILGYIYVKTDSIWPCVAVHFANNAISVIFSYLGDALSVNLQNVLYLVYLMGAMVLAIVGVLLLAKGGKEDYALTPTDTSQVTTKQKYVWFLTAPAIIIFFAFNIFEALSYFSFFNELVSALLGMALGGIG